jgi:hypothetical protein
VLSTIFRGRLIFSDDSSPFSGEKKKKGRFGGVKLTGFKTSTP